MITQVEFLKHNSHKSFAIVDAAMNDLIRPCLYDAWHTISEVITPSDNSQTSTYDVVGPVCETADFLGKDRKLSIASGDYLAVHSAGAYSFVMSSNYNTRPRATEVMVNDEQWQVIRKREMVEDLFKDESIAKW